MTVIAAYTDGKQWAIAADSGVFESGETGIVFSAKGAKIWKRGTALMGAAGSSRACELAEMAPSENPKDIAEFMKKNEASGDWNVLVVTSSGIGYIGDDFSVSHIEMKYMAIGAASAPAIGALSVLDPLEMSAAAKVKAAATASVKHHVWAVGPVKVLKMESTSVD